MGYYVAVPCTSAAKRKDLLLFMDTYFRPTFEFMDWVHQDNWMPHPANGKAICAYAKLNEVGWYRNAGWDVEHRHYASCLLRWMAMKVGKTLTTRDDQIPGYGPLEVHYTIYEGECNVFVTRTQCPNVPEGRDAEGYEVCDDLGWNRSMHGPDPGEDPEWDAECSPYILELRNRKAKADPLIQAELGRLEALWFQSCPDWN